MTYQRYILDFVWSGMFVLHTRLEKLPFLALLLDIIKILVKSFGIGHPNLLALFKWTYSPVNAHISPTWPNIVILL